jgi:hypothetical protein
VFAEQFLKMAECTLNNFSDDSVIAKKQNGKFQPNTLKK